jgi:hypothetical protein
MAPNPKIKLPRQQCETGQRKSKQEVDDNNSIPLTSKSNSSSFPESHCSRGWLLEYLVFETL